MWYIVRLDSSRVATLVKVRSATLVSSSHPTRVKSNYIPVETTILRQIERCPGLHIYLYCLTCIASNRKHSRIWSLPLCLVCPLPTYSPFPSSRSVYFFLLSCLFPHNICHVCSTSHLPCLFQHNICIVCSITTSVMSDPRTYLFPHNSVMFAPSPLYCVCSSKLKYMSCLFPQNSALYVP